MPTTHCHERNARKLYNSHDQAAGLPPISAPIIQLKRLSISHWKCRVVAEVLLPWLAEKVSSSILPLRPLSRAPSKVPYLKPFTRLTVVAALLEAGATGLLVVVMMMRCFASP